MKQSLESYLVNVSQLKETINNCFLISALNTKDAAEIISSSHIETLNSNDILFSKGDEINYIYLLLEGGVNLQILAANGEEKIIDVIRAGQTFAEAVLFSGAPQYPVTAIASADSVVVAFNAKKIKAMLKSSNELCLAMMTKLSRRLHWMVNEVDQLTLHNATFRLTYYLLSQAKSTQQNNQAIIHLPVSKKVLASRLSIKPETLSRIFKRLTKKQLISREDVNIKLLDIDALQQQLLF